MDIMKQINQAQKAREAATNLQLSVDQQLQLTLNSSKFNEAAILTLDGVGEWATTTLAIGTNNKIEMLKEIHFPHSLGLFYSAFTYYCGFKVNSGEYKLMGLAPYGKAIYEKKMIDKLFI